MEEKNRTAEKTRTAFKIDPPLSMERTQRIAEPELLTVSSILASADNAADPVETASEKTVAGEEPEVRGGIAETATAQESEAGASEVQKAESEVTAAQESEADTNEPQRVPKDGSETDEEGGKKPLIFAETTEGRQMSKRLSAAGIAHIVCVNAGYGSLVIGQDSHADVRQGRLSPAETKAVVQQASIVFDATQPYEKDISRNIREAAAASGTEYVRIAHSGVHIAGGGVRVFSDAAECAEALAATEGNILLTTGSNDLHFYAQDEGVRKRIFARVLPSVENVTLCEAFGIKGRHVIAMQGPFSSETDLALIKQFDIRILVTKSNSAAGGYDEKAQAAAKAGAVLFVIGKPADERCISVNEALNKYFDLKPLIQVDIVGTGPGRAGLMTAEAAEAVENADMLFGAPRMIEPYKEKKALPFYRAEEILYVLKEERPERIAVLFSGDTGFYSGASAAKAELEERLGDSGFDCSIKIHPGISSYSYLAAAAGISYSDAGFCSIHGRTSDDKALENVLRTVRSRQHTFILLSGAEDVRKLGSLFIESGLESCTVVLGNHLSYDDEIIAALTPERCVSVVREGLYTALVVNNNAAADDGHEHECENQEISAAEESTHAEEIPRSDETLTEDAAAKTPHPAVGRRLMPVIDDESFVRGRVPASRDNIRHLSILKMDLKDDSVVYDIGSGTGSVACEIAALNDNIRVYAVDMKEEACVLIKQNADRFGLGNIGIIYGMAPEAFAELEAPTHAFIGGSSGKLRSIVEALRNKAKASGTAIRVVVNAVSLETMAEIQDLIKADDILDISMEQIAVSRSKDMGSYHLMTAENPVMIAAFTIMGGK